MTALAEIQEYIEKKAMGYVMCPIDTLVLERWSASLEKDAYEEAERMRVQYEEGYSRGFEDGRADKPTEITLEDADAAITVLKKLTPLNRTKALIKVMESYP